MSSQNNQPNHTTNDLFAEVASDALSLEALALSEKMTPLEMRATTSLASIYGCLLYTSN